MSYERGHTVRMGPARRVKRIKRSAAIARGIAGLAGLGDTGSDSTSYDYSGHPECDPNSDQYYQKADPTGLTWNYQGAACNAIYPPPSTQGGSDTVTGCQQQADSALAALGNMTPDLQKTWSPSGYYDSKTIRSIVAAQQQLLNSGYAAITQTLASNPPTDSANLVKDNKDRLDQVGAQAQNYLDAANTADAKGVTAIAAPGLKDWVLDTIDATYNAMHAAYVVACVEPWWYAAYSAVATVATAFYSAAKAIVGLALKAGEAVIHATEGSLDLISFVTNNAIYIAAGVAAYLLLRKKAA